MRGLVLAGGGLAGIAWELGVLRGIADHDPDLAAALIAADVVIGTSAGATVAAQITSGVDLDRLYEAQLAPTATEIDIEFNVEQTFSRFIDAANTAASPEAARQVMGAIALETPTIPEARRRAVLEARLPTTDWPPQRVLITAIDALTGELVVFERDSGADLVDAVTASSAVPGVWPPATVNGRRYIDGGMRSGTNADLAAGCDQVLIIKPGLPGTPSPWGRFEDELDALAPADVLVIYGDEAAVAAFGLNPLSTATRTPSAQAGRALGRARAGEVAALWR